MLDLRKMVGGFEGAAFDNYTRAQRTPKPIGLGGQSKILIGAQTITQLGFIVTLYPLGSKIDTNLISM